MTDKNLSREWKSAEQYRGDAPSGTLNEFQNPEMLQEPGDAARREFLKIMGAGVALTGFVGCSRPVEKIIPELNRPDQFTPGAKVWYASACQGCADACGVQIKTIDGRPIKVEGRRSSLVGQGGLCTSAQGATWDLYDPERLQEGRVSGKTAKIADVDAAVVAALKTAKSVRYLRGAYPSESRRRVVAGLLAGTADGAEVVFEPMGFDAALKAQEALFGKKVLPRVRLEKADRILDLGSDFLNTGWSRLDLARGLSARRDLDSAREPVRLTTLEGVLSHTGTNADDRLVVRHSLVTDIGLAIAAELAKGQALDAKIAAVLAPYSLASAAKASGLAETRLKALADDLAAHKGASVVFAAPTVRGQVAAAILNLLLGAEGTVLDGVVAPSLQGETSAKDIVALIEEMKAGKVDVLILDNVNPAYSLPASLGFAEALAKVPTVVSLAQNYDETAELSKFVLPLTHWLENWGESEPQAGVHHLSQPTISPLFVAARSSQDIVLSWTVALAKATPFAALTYHDVVKGYWGELQTKYGILGTATSFWEDGLRQGGFVSAAVRKARSEASAARVAAPTDLSVVGAPVQSLGDIEVAPFWTASIRDGSQGSNPHIQEVPDPVTKMVWGNAALLGPSLAAKLGVKTEDQVQVEVNGATLLLPAFVIPGMHKEVVAIALGYGRTAKLRMLEGNPEFPIWLDLAYAQDSQGMGSKIPTVGLDIGKYAGLEKVAPLAGKISSTGKEGRLASTQLLHDIAHEEKPGSQDWRQIAIQVTFDEYKKDAKAGNPESHVELFTVWGDPGYTAEQKWGMVIDMNRCNGCSACIVGCSVENNVPAVGFEEVRRGRDMQWLRIDRYYHGDLEAPELTHQPMVCAQCDNAPCETVCPVVATTHSDDGLNQMTYNRCIGTRYCANNCPYKVRHFNWTNNWKSMGITDLYAKTPDGRTPNASLAMAFNPEVTVRTRGVMEKCTFCVQRIQNARHDAKEMGLSKVPDGELLTACQQSCPAEAIVFGDVKDPESKVSKMMRSERGYRVLEWLQVKPNVVYLPRVRHTADTGAVSTAVAAKVAMGGGHEAGHGEHGAPAHGTHGAEKPSNGADHEHH